MGTHRGDFEDAFGANSHLIVIWVLFRAIIGHILLPFWSRCREKNLVNTCHWFGNHPERMLLSLLLLLEVAALSDGRERFELRKGAKGGISVFGSLPN